MFCYFYQVKLLAKEKYNYNFTKDEQISPFVAAFHDGNFLSFK